MRFSKPGSNKPLPKASTTTRTTMEPSRRRQGVTPLGAASASRDAPDESATSSVLAARVEPIPHPEEANIYQLPDDLHPVYRPLPFLGRLFLSVATLLTTMATSYPMTTKQKPLWMIPVAVWRCMVTESNSGGGGVPWKALLWFCFKIFLMYTVAAAALQECLPNCRPSRIATKELRRRYFLPSRLSNYDDTLHWLEYSQSLQQQQQPPFDYQAGYVNHGFGASSLSWLPALPQLAQSLRIRTVLGHDAPGFGFTSRKKNLQHYTFENSARLGSSLLQRNLLSGNNQPVLLFGHSMGSLTTLRMALSLDATIPFRMILVAPALGMIPKKSPRSSLQNIQCLLGRPFSPVLNALGMYTLRRIVGWKNAWRKGLEGVWGNPKAVRNSDVLRFQWPAIGKGWERGLMQFTAAQSQGLVNSDKDLLQAVLDSPNCMGVDVIVGDKDRVVPIKYLRNFFADSKIPITELEGMGHDPFEEDTAGFVRVVQELLDKGAV